METFQATTRLLHASLGAVCLISGVIALTAEKSRGRHTTSGRICVISLALCFAGILPNILMKANIFMLGVGWLAVYAGLEGWRALLRFRGRVALTLGPFDYVLNGASALMSAILTGFGVKVLLGAGNMMGLVCIGFGLLGAVLIHGAWKRGKTPPSKKELLALHIQMMCGAFSAALTAFFAIQLSGRLGGFEWIVWVLPTVIMSRYGAYEVKRRNLVQTP